MGIYDREYYRERTRGSGWLSGTSPAVKAILLINCGVFLLQMLSSGNGDPITTWFSASSRAIFEGWEVWRLFTAPFLHSPDNLLHLAFNMLFLWMVGREMESFYTTREFWWLYLSAGFVSTLCWALLDYRRGVDGGSMVGASGAVMTIVALYTFYHPRREVILFIFPVEMWLLLTLYVGSDAFGLISQRAGRIAVAAHLGGFAYAVAFYYFDLRLKRIGALFERRRPRLRIVHPDPPPRREPQADRPSPSSPTWSPGPATTTRTATAPAVTQEQLDARLDEILVKIAREGRSGLDDDEKRILEEASRRARDRRRERI